MARLFRHRQNLSKTKPHRWICARQSAIHGRGVYASCDIPDGTRVIEYTGERVTKAESRKREEQRLKRQQRGGDDDCVYIFDLNKKHDLDGRSTRNVARLINHSCAPNCLADNIGGHIWIVARRDIAAGEELTFDYGFPYAEWRLHPCRCGSPRCVGFIVNKEQRWRVRRLLRGKRKALPTDQSLKPLNSVTATSPADRSRRL